MPGLSYTQTESQIVSCNSWDKKERGGRIQGSEVAKLGGNWSLRDSHLTSLMLAGLVYLSINSCLFINNSAFDFVVPTLA